HRAVEVVEGDQVGDADAVGESDVVEGVARPDRDGSRGRGVGLHGPWDLQDLTRTQLIARDPVELSQGSDVGAGALGDAPEGIPGLDVDGLGGGYGGHQGEDRNEEKKAPG